MSYNRQVRTCLDRSQNPTSKVVIVGLSFSSSIFVNHFVLELGARGKNQENFLLKS